MGVIFRKGRKKRCKSRNYLIYTCICGERGIRTPGTSRYGGFQDRCNRPLYHLSSGVISELRCKDSTFFENKKDFTLFFQNIFLTNA